MNTIFFLSNNKIITEKLRAHIKRQYFIFKKFDVKEVPADMKYFIIVEPYQIRGYNYGIHEIWKDYLKSKNYKDTKLIVAGFDFHSQGDCSNYLNLSKVPADLNETLNGAQTLKTDWIIRQGDHQLRDKLEQFFKGHGDQSLFLKLNYLRMALINTLDSLDGTNGRSYEDAAKSMLPLSQKLWKEFLGRWDNYKIYFACTPFYEMEKRIKNLIEEIEPFFDIPKPTKEQFLYYPCLQNIEVIRAELKKMDKYVRPQI